MSELEETTKLIDKANKNISGQGGVSLSPLYSVGKQLWRGRGGFISFDDIYKTLDGEMSLKRKNSLIKVLNLNFITKRYIG